MMKDLLANSYLFGGNAPFVEELYEAYLNTPQSVPEAWREYFDKLQVLPAATAEGGRDVAHAPIVDAFAQRAKQGTLRARAASPPGGAGEAGGSPPPHGTEPPARRARSVNRRITTSPRPISRRSSTPERWSGRNAQPCARSCRCSARPTAARSARSTCTSPIRGRSAGSSSAWRRCGVGRSSPPR